MRLFLRYSHASTAPTRATKSDTSTGGASHQQPRGPAIDVPWLVNPSARVGRRVVPLLTGPNITPELPAKQPL